MSDETIGEPAVDDVEPSTSVPPDPTLLATPLQHQCARNKLAFMAGGGLVAVVGGLAIIQYVPMACVMLSVIAWAVFYAPLFRRIKEALPTGTSPDNDTLKAAAISVWFLGLMPVMSALFYMYPDPDHAHVPGYYSVGYMNISGLVQGAMFSAMLAFVLTVASLTVNSILGSYNKTNLSAVGKFVLPTLVLIVALTYIPFMAPILVCGVLLFARERFIGLAEDQAHGFMLNWLQLAAGLSLVGAWIFQGLAHGLGNAGPAMPIFLVNMSVLIMSLVGGGAAVGLCLIIKGLATDAYRAVLLSCMGEGATEATQDNTGEVSTETGTHDGASPLANGETPV